MPCPVYDFPAALMGGMVDELLNVGYLQQLVALSDHQEPIYTRLWREHKEQVTVHVVDNLIEFRYMGGLSDITYVLRCGLDMHLRVTSSTLTVVNGKPIEAITQFAQAVVSFQQSIDTFGNARKN